MLANWGPTSGARHLSGRVVMLANKGAHIRCQAPVRASRHASKLGAHIGAGHLRWQVGMLAKMGQKIGTRHLLRHDPSDPSYLVWSGANAMGFWPA